MSNEPARLILLRHFETTWNRDGRFLSRSDVGLNEAGAAHARASAAALARLPLVRVVSSPARRCVERHEIVADVAGLEVEVDERLREVDFGPFEGHSAQELRSGELGGAFSRWRDSDDPEFPDGFEPYSAVAERVRPAFDDLSGASGVSVAVT